MYRIVHTYEWQSEDMKKAVRFIRLLLDFIRNIVRAVYGLG